MTETYSSFFENDHIRIMDRPKFDHGVRLNICHKIDMLNLNITNGWYNFGCRHFEVNDIGYADVCHEVSMLFVRI